MSEPTIPVIDLAPWLSGDPAARAETARTVDRALRTAGFLLVTGHGVEPELRAAIRREARRFFHLDPRVKEPYAVKVGGRGWLGPGAEANAYAEGTASPPDLKESLSFAADEPTGDPVVDAEWFLPNTWPAEVPGLRPPVEEYLARMRELSDRLLGLLGVALGRARTSSQGTPPTPPGGSTSTGIRGGTWSVSRSRASSGSGRTPTSAP